MTGWNTIILLKGEAVLTSSEMKFCVMQMYNDEITKDISYELQEYT